MSTNCKAPALGETVKMLSEVAHGNRDIAMLIKNFAFGDDECKLSNVSVEGVPRCMAEEIMMTLEVIRITNKILCEIAEKLGVAS